VNSHADEIVIYAPYDFFAYAFFAVALEVAPGSLEFLFESERAESATANSSFLHMIADN